jgi:nitroreductase
MIELLFEAARWAPSAMNEQPWEFYYIRRENKTVFNELVEILTGINPGWAKNAQLLIVSVVKKNYDYQNRENRNALHDLGAANVSLAIQAAEMGLQVHQMAGFDKEKATDFLKLDNNNFAPVTIFAVGFPGDPNQLPDDLKQRELNPRKR